MSHRFLPFVRRGLADRIPDQDTLGPSIPARAGFPVRVTLSTGDLADLDLRVNGPGDVIGVDPRGIIRLDPPRFARNVEPDNFVALEFAEPDFPWMFTPAAAGTDDRLRPWLVLVVVAKQPGVAVVVDRERPLPRLIIENPAVPGDELPDLSESWAWAHTHVIEEAAPASVAAHLHQHPELNVSRLLCPRRLEPGRDYLAALVPAFESGRLAGLGQPVPDADTTTPAWGAGGGVGATVTLPTYFHWEFRTGPAGDFESLARALVPRPVPDTVGRRRMSISQAHPSLPALAPDAGGVIDLEGALRAPDPGDGPSLGPEHKPFTDKLAELLDAPAAQVIDGATPDAEVVAPPIYGGRHVQVETLAGSSHVWLNELNKDPRHRAAAGLGTEVVRLNQERWMQAAWEQVGDVLAANALLDRARFLQRIGERIHQRHIRPLAADVAFTVTAPVHRRIVIDGRSVARRVAASTVSDGVLDPSFRRLFSPRSVPFTRAVRHAVEPGAAVSVTAVAKLASGNLQLDLLAAPPDGLVSSRLLDRFGSSPSGSVGPEIGAVGQAPATMVRQLRTLTRTLSEKPPATTVTLRPNLAKTGILLPRQRVVLEAATAGLVMAGTATSAGATTTVAGLAETILTASAQNPDALGFVVAAGTRGVDLDILQVRGPESVIVSRPLNHRGRIATVARLDNRRRTIPVGQLRSLVGRSGPGVFVPRGRELPRIVIPASTGGRLRLNLPDRPTVPPPSTVPTDPGPPSLDPPVKDIRVIDRFVSSFDGNRELITAAVSSIIPPPAPLDLTLVRSALVTATAPRAVIEARATLSVRIGDGLLRNGLPGIRFRQREPLDPVMVGPDIDEPLYQALADADPDRFLPGVGDIPDDTLTLLETNPRFVEAFLVGANHEMNREMLWRRYPTDSRATPFRHFWDRVDGAPDIGPINEFTSTFRLGTNSGADLRGSLVLLVRGRLLRRYPETVVYAAPAKFDGSFDKNPSVIEDPVFWGRIAPDITFVGFDLTREDVEPAPGWYFVLAEQTAAPRFGLDVTGPVGPPGDWSNLHWGQVGAGPGQHLVIADSGLAGRNRPLVENGTVRATFGRNSADMAAITFQRPFRAIVHTSELLDGSDGKGLGGLLPVLARSVLLRPIELSGGGG